MSVLKFIAAAESAGWHYQPCGTRSPSGEWQANPDALTIGGCTFPTLLRGPVATAWGNTDLYYHGGRVWKGDPSDQADDRIVLEGIVVSGESRRHGLATAAVRDLQSIAASLGKAIVLEAVSIAAFKVKGQRTISPRRLVQWYKSLGFESRWPREGDRILVWRAE
jgi:GNAT superfamily N-acetyltransferase